MNCLTELYYIKKYILMLENLKGNNDFSKGLFEEFRKKNVEPSDETMLLSQICEFRDILKDSIPEEQLDEWEYSDYDVYTDEHHHRQFWNEIENEEIVEYFFGLFTKILELEVSETSEFFVSLYDFHDEALYFENETDMESFLCNYDCAPYTAFQIHEDYNEELYSA